ncbi:alpha-amylase family glycosyl hydrolase [Roseisolibacter sp. H3M3-2]|uniref:alpha-amylase family glycosyl hydrolase n=1 Tax=Roseisolibacter sp. H3M3-2 TaxID=3031323 RepID=UPI0023DBE967|nr:alpha-amylase family glycosyl hydrolase [Roseisolibacter sp. H3M3-2]MDF1504080.1 alpha-amylase family glycosyl hydrolase [Roseisolibacter sp. H3M3-2]
MRRLLLPAAVAALAGCGGAPAADAPPTSTPAAPASASVAHPEWAGHANIYEVNVRQYTPEGTLRAFQAHLPRLKALGADILWLMPVQPIGVKNRKGPLGSYYSVSDYRAINPEFGTEADMRALVDDAHARGMRVILDWVPNHTAFDHTWVAAHPDWYVRNPDGSISNARDNEGKATDWTDVAELDYAKPEMRRAMLADMRWWLDSMKVDGFRCDVAGGVPDDFWAEARRELGAGRPGLFLLAEAEAPKAHAAFDMTYGWELHHLLNAIAKGEKGTSELDRYFARQDSTYPRGAMRMYFTSNHDENSWQGTEFERMGENHRPAFVLAATVAGGTPLVYTGQEAGLNRRLRFFEKDTVRWSDTTLTPFYRALLDLKHRQPPLGNGELGGTQAALRTDGGDRTWAFTRTRGQKVVLVAVNFGDAPKTLRYEGLAAPGAYTDWFDRTVTTRLAASGTLDVPAHGWRVLFH